MMLTQGITPNFATNNVQYKNNNVKNSVSFKGAIGDKFVREMVSGNDVEVSKMMEAVKGTFGLKSEKVSDVFESLTQKIASLLSENREQKALINSQADKIAEFPKKEQNSVFEAVDSVRKSMSEALGKTKAELAEKNAEVEQLKKYKGMASVKSVEEVDSLMPDQIVKLFGKMRDKKEASLDSMHNFLLNGKGQEEALAQIERNNQLLGAARDGMFNIPELKKVQEENQKLGLWIQNPVSFAEGLISKALEGSKEGQYLESTAMSSQIKKNAKAILNPLVDGKYETYSEKDLDVLLDRLFDGIKKFHRNFAKGKECMAKEGHRADSIHNVKYDNVNSTITYKEQDGSERVLSFYQLANIGEYRR